MRHMPLIRCARPDLLLSPPNVLQRRSNIHLSEVTKAMAEQHPTWA